MTVNVMSIVVCLGLCSCHSSASFICSCPEDKISNLKPFAGDETRELVARGKKTLKRSELVTLGDAPIGERLFMLLG